MFRVGTFSGVLGVILNGEVELGSAMVCIKVHGVIGERLFIGVGVGVWVLGVLGCLSLGLALIFRPVAVTHCSSAGLYGSLPVIAKGFVAVSFFVIVIGMAGVVVVGLGVVVLLTWELGWALVVGGTADVVTAGFVVEEGSQNLSAPAPTHLPHHNYWPIPSLTVHTPDRAPPLILLR